jgi:hypothetical protein
VDKSIGEIIQAAVDDGLFVKVEGKLHRHYRGDLKSPSYLAEPVPVVSRDVNITYDRTSYSTTVNRVLYTIESGEWPYGLAVRRAKEGLIATIGFNSWVTEDSMERMLAAYVEGETLANLSAEYGVAPRSVYQIASRWLTGSQKAEAATNRSRSTPCSCGKPSRSGTCYRCRRKRPRKACSCGRQMNRGRDVCGRCRKAQRALKLHPCPCGRRRTKADRCYLCNTDHK